MKKRFKNKLLTILLLLSFLTIILGLLFPAFLEQEVKTTINQNIVDLQKQIKDEPFTIKKFITVAGENLSPIILIWTLGISIIGIPIIIFLYLGKILLYSMEFSFLLLNIKKINLLFIISYILPVLATIFIQFFLLYYALQYSIILIKLLFCKKEYQIKKITKNYLRILGISIVGILLITILETIVFPKIVLFF